MFNKKGFIAQARDFWFVGMGFIMIAFGGLLTAQQLKFIDFLPEFFMSLPIMVFLLLMTVGGVIVIVGGVLEPNFDSFLHWFLMLVGLVILAVGIIPVLNSMGIIGFTIPFITTVPLLLFYIIIDFVGLLLIIAGFTMH